MVRFAEGREGRVVGVGVGCGGGEGVGGTAVLEGVHRWLVVGGWEEERVQEGVGGKIQERGRDTGNLSSRVSAISVVQSAL